ncbi:hypothetical protein HN51_062174 [Arachis hypogaea]|nr:heat shock factor protein-like [Arachis hypogaea]
MYVREPNGVANEEIDVNDSNIYLELEDLITRPTDWVGSASAGGLVAKRVFVHISTTTKRKRAQYFKAL